MPKRIPKKPQPKQKLNPQNKQSSLPIKDWINQYKEQFQRYNVYCKENDWSTSSNKEEDYDVQKDISNIVLDRLKYFLKKFEPYKDYKYVKEFVELMNTSVTLFLDRCNRYYIDNDWSTIVDREKKKDEMKFQAEVMSDFNKIKDKLQELNLDNEVISLELPIHSEKKIPFLMETMLEEKFPQIKEYKRVVKENFEEGIDTITHTPYDVSKSTELFINIKNPPPYNPMKHYFEQSKDTIQFYNLELDKITKGVTIAGVFIHPWLYWHLNYFKTDLPILDTNSTIFQKEIACPPLRDNELFFADCYKKASEANVGLFLFGSRRWAKTTVEASVLTWLTTTIELSESIVLGGDEGDLQKLSKSLEIGFANVHPAFKLPRNNNDWSSHIQFGLKNKASERIPYSDIFIKNVNHGKESSSEKSAGVTPTAWIVDEAGKFNVKQTYLAALPSFQNPRGWSVTPILSGTGGNKVLSKDAQEMLTNPEANYILPMDWDYLENKIPESRFITWKRKSFGIFLPSQMSYKEGIEKKDTNLADYLGVDEKTLRKIDIKVTDWEHSSKVIEATRKKVSSDRTTSNKEKMAYPLKPEECFLNRIDNPFPASEGQDHKENLVREGAGGKAVDIYKKKGSTNISYNLSEKELATSDFQGGNIDAPVLILEEPPEDNEMDGTYVAGLDHYKHDKSSTNSLGAMYIFKRNVNLNDVWGDRIVASYCSRPDSIETFNNIAEMLIEGYGAECLQENADISFQQHLKRKHKDTMWLANGEELARKNLNPNATQNNKYGLNPSQKNQQYMLNLVVSYCVDDIEVGVDDAGNPITQKGIYRINDIALLDEMISFNYTGNFDRIIAFGHALAWARYLDSINIMPKVKKNKEDRQGYKKQKRALITKGYSPYSNRRYNMYKG